jgi:hypothetical protein
MILGGKQVSTNFCNGEEIYWRSDSIHLGMLSSLTA